MENRETKEKNKVQFTNFYPLLSIGQMIEFLEKHHSNNENIIPVRDDCSEHHWTIKYAHGSNHHNELADALWEAVRVVLVDKYANH